MTRLSQFSIKERSKIVKFEKTSLLTRNCIKHLHSHLSNLLKKFCDIFKDNTKNKRWKETNKIYKIKADNSCFLMLLDKMSRQESKISEYHLINSFDPRIATTNVWFIDELIRIEQRNKKLKKLAKKHIAWKKKTLAKYSKECEQYIHERRDWEMSVVIQTWNKSEIFWSIQISSFSHLLNLVESKHAIQKEYTKLIKNEDISRTTINVYEDEIEEKVSSDSKKSNDLEDESVNISEDIEQNFSILSFTDEHLMIETLIENISKRDINTTLIDIREETMTDIEE